VNTQKSVISSCNSFNNQNSVISNCNNQNAVNSNHVNNQNCVSINSRIGQNNDCGNESTLNFVNSCLNRAPEKCVSVFLTETKQEPEEGQEQDRLDETREEQDSADKYNIKQDCAEYEGMHSAEQYGMGEQGGTEEDNGEQDSAEHDRLLIDETVSTDQVGAPLA
jgi:hypothetical protein